uniref:CBS domain-containing protein n=1 Tax=Archaeoglobus fulgidus TaxID=2234 RepID=A0A7J2TGN9_ARCFL
MIDLSSEVTKIATRDVQTLPQTATIMSAIRFMLSKNFRRFPITDAGTKRLRGIITATDFVNFFGGGSKYGIVRNRYSGNLSIAVNAEVKEIMERNVVSIEEDASIGDLIELMFKKRIGGCPVVDEDETVVGIVTERDLLKFLARNRKIDGVASEFMTKSVVTIGAKDTIETAMKTMISKRFRRLPVIENGILLGLITSREILAYFGKGEAFRMLESGDVREAIRRPVSAILVNEEINQHRDVLIFPKDAFVSQIASSMLEKGHGVALIVESGRLEGIITERDLLKFLYESS